VIGEEAEAGEEGEGAEEGLITKGRMNVIPKRAGSRSSGMRTRGVRPTK
jgi:hypothetical protein